MGYYYHYTDEDGARGIRRSRMIKASYVHTRDAAFGDGVYFTRLNPATNKKVLANNNWQRNYIADKLTYVVKVLFHENGRKPKRPNDAGDRDIFLFNGNVYLDDMRWWTIEEVRKTMYDMARWNEKQVRDNKLSDFESGLIALMTILMIVVMVAKHEKRENRRKREPACNIM